MKKADEIWQKGNKKFLARGNKPRGSKGSCVCFVCGYLEGYNDSSKDCKKAKI